MAWGYVEMTAYLVDSKTGIARRVGYAGILYNH